MAISKQELQPDKRLNLKSHIIINSEALDVGIWPEKKLMVAILQRALLDASGNTSLTQRSTKYMNKEQVCASDWIFSQSSEIYSYEWICDTLDLDPSIIRNLTKQNIKLTFDGNRYVPLSN